MKLLVILSMALSFSAFACGGSNKTVSTDDAVKTIKSATKKKSAKAVKTEAKKKVEVKS